MLATLKCDTGHNTFNELKGIRASLTSLRMSNFDSFPQRENQRQDSSYPFPGETVSSHFEHPATSNVVPNELNREAGNVPGSHQEHHHTFGPPLQQFHAGSVLCPPQSYLDNRLSNTIQEEPLGSHVSSRVAHGSSETNPLLSPSTAPVKREGSHVFTSQDRMDSRDEEDEEDDMDADDYILDSSGGNMTQTAAERRAERRKMKRFRLTHQQTRFLMSEFAKQAHPDSAHRERLSREIPGLSPRQVQVWFQNRRAKIKRLTADDRERMMRMRAVPDDFDNVQALHSPYGVQPSAGQIPAQAGFISSYNDGLARPLHIDTMQGDDRKIQMSPTGISPAFSSAGYGSGSAIDGSDALSPSSSSYQDRYFQGLHRPGSSGSSSSNVLERSNTYHMFNSPRQHIRPTQPLSLHDNVPRSDSIQSPLRSSMSWTGGTLEFGSYQTMQHSPQLRSRHSMYIVENMGDNPVTPHRYETGVYSNPSTYPPSQPPASAEEPFPSAMRLRAASVVYPPGHNLQFPYPPAPSQSPQVQRHSPIAKRSRSSASGFTTGYANAPLTSPVGVEYSIPPRPQLGYRPERDFSTLREPMAPPPSSEAHYQGLYSGVGMVGPTNSSTQRPEFNTQAGGFQESSPHRQQQQKQTPRLGEPAQHHQHQIPSHAPANEQTGTTAVAVAGPYNATLGYETGLKRKREFDLQPGLESPLSD